MHCLYCGKPLGFLKELTGGEFCSSQHRQRYAKLTKLALNRLLETRTEAGGDSSKHSPDLGAPLPSDTSAPAGGADRMTLNLCEPFPHDPQARTVPARPRLSQDTIGGPPLPPSLPVFSPPAMHPALAGAEAVHPKPEPALPALPRLTAGESIVPLCLSQAIPRIGTVVNRLRQTELSALRRAELSPASPVLPQRDGASSRCDDSPAATCGEFSPAVVLPGVPREAAGCSLRLAQSVSYPHAGTIPAPRAMTALSQVTPVVFERRPVWTAARWLLSPEAPPLFSVSDLSSRVIVEDAFTSGLRVRAAPAAMLPVFGTSYLGWRPLSPAPAVSFPPPAASAGLAEARFRAPALAAREGLCQSQAPIVPPVTAASPVIPQLTASPGSALAAAGFQAPALEAQEGLRPIWSMAAPQLTPAVPVISASAASIGRALAEADLRSMCSPESAAGTVPEMAGPLLAPTEGNGRLPLSVTLRAVLGVGGATPQPGMPPKGRLLGSAEPLSMSVSRVRLPALEAAPLRETLRVAPSLRGEVGLLDAPAEPAPSPDVEPVSPTLKLPALVSLFRAVRPSRSSRVAHIGPDAVKLRNPPCVPFAYEDLPMPARPPVLPTGSALRIEETFEYLRPLEQPKRDLLQALLQLWRRTPALVRFAAVSASLLFLLWVAAPNVRMAAAIENRWGQLQAAIGSRAAVELTDNFRDGLPAWEGQGQWQPSWSVEPAGYVYPGRLALYQPSMTMEDYRFEFLAQIERRSVGWVYRASDHENYYAGKITVVKPGPLPSVALIRYPVIGGKAGPQVEIPIRVLMHNNTPYRVQVEVKGTNFTTSIEGQLVDFWRDDRLRTGGVGFFSDTGERARLYWMRLSHQDDFIGRVCAYLYPNPIARSWN